MHAIMNIEFENRWQRKYYFIILVVAFFLVPMWVTSASEGALSSTSVHITALGIFSVFFIAGLLFTSVKGEEKFLDRIRTDKKILIHMLLRMVIVGGVLAIYFFMTSL